MSGNLYGSAFRVMTFGESHGPYIGLVIDGLKPGLEIDIKQMQAELDRRRPGQSNVVTPRKEEDRAEIISGIFEGKTTGTPLCILIRNQDQRSEDYQKLKDMLRPGHAAFSFLQKYGIFDYHGGGRASGRETATRVAAGAVAKQILKNKGIEIHGYTRRIDHVEITSVDLDEIENNPVRTADAQAAVRMTKAIQNAQKNGDSLGGIIEILVRNCPPGLGEPVFNKLEADLAQLLMSVGAVKGFEMGEFQGLDIIQGKVILFDKSRVGKIPQIGWNNVEFQNDNHFIIRGIPNNSYFYFVHSFYVFFESFKFLRYSYFFYFAVKCKTLFFFVFPCS